MEELDYDEFMRTSSATVLGHEFVGEVVERGRGTRREFREGAHVVSFPLVRRGKDVHPIGLSPRAPGGYAEQVLVEQSMSFVVPNGLPPDVAVLTEPMAVALHAVNKSEVAKKDVAIVLGCGPVGLAVISWLKARGVRTIVASDLSAGRRALATASGADVVVDPTEESPYDVAPAKHTHLGSGPVPARGRLDGPAPPGARLAARLPRRRRARRRDAVRPGHLRVRRRARA